MVGFYTKFAEEPFPRMTKDRYDELVKSSKFDTFYPKWCVELLDMIQKDPIYDRKQWLYFFDSNKPKTQENGFFCDCDEPHHGIPSTTPSKEVNRLLNFMRDSDLIAGTMHIKEMISTKVATQ